MASLLAVALLTCSAFAMDFHDVPKDADYAAEIQYVSESGIMVGDNQGNFNPNQIVNRAEMATIVCHVLNQPKNLSKSNVFTDVPTIHWTNANIGKASELGIVGGYGNRKFDPSDPVTYEQAVTMIVRAIGEGNRASSNGGYPKGFLLMAQEKNLLNGIQTVQGQGLSRGTVAMLLYHYYTTQNNPGTSSNAGDHIHNYVTQQKIIEHSEQVQTGTKMVNEYATVTEYHCRACDFTTYDPAELQRHQPAELDSGMPCAGCGWWSKTTTKVVGTHEEQP